MRGNTHFVVLTTKFEPQANADESVTTYTFGMRKHAFCKVCGITSYYTPRTNPDDLVVTAACLDPVTLDHVEYRKADGRK
uniref:CENP-V/GFA domain-containing protein n=1 Tax=Zea mays TaxID=4577 RepID=A0A804MN69_MAIZE